MKVLTGVALTLALAAPAAAQGAAGPGTGLTGSLVGAGLSFLNIPGDDEIDGTTFKGFVVDFRKNIYATTSADIGIVGDLGWHRHSEEFEEFDEFDSSFTFVTFMGGVRATASRLDRVAPFGQFLVGVVRGSIGGNICDTDDDDFCDAESDGAIAFGGGVDVRLTDRLNFRAQIDFLKVMEEDSDLATRFTVGVSTHFGRR